MLLRHIVGVLLHIEVDAIGLHEVFGEARPRCVLVFPDFALPRNDGESAVRLVTES